MENPQQRSKESIGADEPAKGKAATISTFFALRNIWLAAILIAGAGLAQPAAAQPFGMVADDATVTVNVFDVDTNNVVAALPLDPGIVGDVVITADQTLGFVSDFNLQVWVVDLTTSPPSLAAGTNPIPVSTKSEDLSVTPDGRYLLVSDGIGDSNLTPLLVVDIAARAEVSTFTNSPDVVANDLCDDGTSVLIASFSGNNVRRLKLAADGSLTDTGEVLSLLDAGPFNVYCAPGSRSGVVVNNADQTVSSFTIPGLALVDTRPLTGFGIAGVFSPSGDRVFVRSSFSPDGAIEAFTYDPATGALGTTLADFVSVAPTTPSFGIDQVGISVGGEALYVPERQPVNAVSILDAADLTAAPLGSITGPGIVYPTGIALPSAVPFEDFEVALELEHDEFELDDGEFTLGAASNGIDPATEDVILEVGSFSATIPAGSFTAAHGGFAFEGVVDGVELEVEIRPIADGAYSFEAEVDLTGEPDPVTVVLAIGDDRGEATVSPDDDSDDDDDDDD